MSQIRYDLFHDRHVIIAPERMHRDGFLLEGGVPDDEDTCPFCETKESLTPPEIDAIRLRGAQDTPGWKVRVVPNLYKMLRIEAPLDHHHEGIYEWQDGFGAHEIIIDTPRHETRMDRWTKEEYVTWLTMIRRRVLDLRNDFRLVYLSVFKNHGRNAAATKGHPHTQIVAMPLVPKAVTARLRHQVAYFDHHGRSVAEALLHEALAQKTRIILQNDSFVALTPYAAAMPFEVWVVTRRQVPSITDLCETGIHALASILETLFVRLYAVLGVFDFNLVFEMPPLHPNGESGAFFERLPQSCRFGVRIVPRLSGIGGLEYATGMFVNPVTPEEAAAKLREAGR